jgi:hypothetical protein
MFASYLDQQGKDPNDIDWFFKDIESIKDEINSGEGRPSALKNAHENMVWWLEKYFAPIRFERKATTDELQALDWVVSHIDQNYPVIVSTNHANVKGHIILVVGYEHYIPFQSTEEFAFICDDPYGQFNPQLNSNLYGKKRFVDGMSLPAGGESAPGKELRLNYDGIRRIRKDQSRTGNFEFISVKL